MSYRVRHSMLLLEIDLALHFLSHRVGVGWDRSRLWDTSDSAAALKVIIITAVDHSWSDCPLQLLIGLPDGWDGRRLLSR